MASSVRLVPRASWSRPRTLALTIAITMAVLASPALAIENNWDKYPSDTHPCLEQSSTDAGCTKGTLAQLNTCLCGNNNDFIVNTAKCLGGEGSADVDETWDVMSDACSWSKTPIAVTKKDFQAAAEEGASADPSTTSKPSADATTTAGGKTVTVEPSKDTDKDENKDADKDDGSGLSTGATIGIGVGAAVIGAAIVAAIAFMLIRRRGAKGEEANPMLVNQEMTPYNNQYHNNPYNHQQQYGGHATTFPPTDPSADVLSPGGGTYNSTQGAWGAAGGVGVTPSPDPSKSSWTSPPQYAGPYAAPPPPTATQNTGYVFEMDGGVDPGRPVEMPGSAPPGR